MRFHLRVRTVMIAIAVLAGLLGAAVGIERRAETFKRLAAYHCQASSTLFDLASGPLFCGTGLTDSHLKRIFYGRGPDQCCAYRASRYHSELADKYAMAAKHPWHPVSNDPPPLAGTFPKFEVDPIYHDLVNDVNSGTGMK